MVLPEPRQDRIAEAVTSCPHAHWDELLKLSKDMESVILAAKVGGWAVTATMEATGGVARYIFVAARAAPSGT